MIQTRARILLILLSLPPGILPAESGEEGLRSPPAAVFPDGHRFALEIADTPEARARGYMFRDQVDRGEGMLFVFPASDFHSFWMKNCKVALDILWLSEELRVVHVEMKVPPCRDDPCPGYAPMRKARYVLEIRSGMAGRSGIHIGDPVRLEGFDPGTLRPPL